jgi:hypothetical protein
MCSLILELHFFLHKSYYDPSWPRRLLIFSHSCLAFFEAIRTRTALNSYSKKKYFILVSNIINSIPQSYAVMFTLYLNSIPTMTYYIISFHKSVVLLVASHAPSTAYYQPCMFAVGWYIRSKWCFSWLLYV